MRDGAAAVLVGPPQVQLLPGAEQVIREPFVEIAWTWCNLGYVRALPYPVYEASEFDLVYEPNMFWHTRNSDVSPNPERLVGVVAHALRSAASSEWGDFSA